LAQAIGLKPQAALSDTVASARACHSPSRAMGARWALPLLACLLSRWGASAGRLQVGRKAHQAAKARFGGRVAGLARALRSGLAVDRQAPELMAELARERLGLEADGLEPAGAALLRSFVGGAPDSVLISPMMEMAGGEDVDAPGDRGFAVMEGPGATPDDQGVVVVQAEEAPEELGAPNFILRDVDGAPSVAPEVGLGAPSFIHGSAEGALGMQNILRQDAVAHAARRLASEMQAIQDTLGREVLQEIVGEFFSDAARRAEQAGAMAAIEAWRHRQALERSLGHLKPRGAIAEHTAGAGGSDRRHVRLWPDLRPGGTPAPNATRPGLAARNRTAARNKTAGPAAMVERATQVSRPLPQQDVAPARAAGAPHEARRGAASSTTRPGSATRGSTGATRSTTATSGTAGPHAWPRGSTNATWHDGRGATLRRTCEGGRCVTRVMRRRAR